MQIVSNIALITINETFFIQMISFLVFLFLLNRIMIRPLKTQIKQRDDYIKTISSNVEENEKKVKGMIKLLQDQEVAVKKEAFEVNKQLKASGDNEAAEILKSSRDKILAIRKKVEIDVNTQISDARKSIKKDAEILALTILEKTLGRRFEV